MKILVLSDTHKLSCEAYIDKIKEQGKFDMLIHCGDYLRDVDEILELTGINKSICVRGNCDFGIDGSDIEFETINGKKFMITHGHRFCVKRGLDDLKKFAKAHNVDVVVYGHTHIAHTEYDDGILYFNPGSVIYPITRIFSFGILTIEDGNVYDEFIEW